MKFMNPQRAGVSGRAVREKGFLVSWVSVANLGINRSGFIFTLPFPPQLV